MSHALYNRQWQQAMEKLSQLINEENPPPKLDDKKKPIVVRNATLLMPALIPYPPPQLPSYPSSPLLHCPQEPPITFYSAYVHTASLYLQYLSVFRALEEAYDQMVHPQKRADIRLTVELCMARIVQLRHDLLLYSSSQPSSLSTPSHPHLSPFLSPLHLPPSALEVPIPHYFQERSDDESERKKRDLVDRLCEENAVMWGTAGHDIGLVSDDQLHRLSSLNRLTREHAIKLIQKNERGRQGAMRAKLMRELREEDARKRLRDAGHHPTRDDAALTIQRAWRGYLTRKRVREEAQEELVFLGMKPAPAAFSQPTITPAAAPPPAGPTAAQSTAAVLPRYDPLAKEQQIRLQRKTRQADAALAYHDALRALEGELEAQEGEQMKAAMWDERYNWWVEEKEKTGKYPLDLGQFYLTRYPDSDEAKAAVTASAPKKGWKAGKAAAVAGKGAKGKEGGKAAGKEAGKGKAVAEAKPAEAAGLTLGPTPIVPQLSACVRRYADVWLGRDEAANPDQGYDREMARAALRPQVERRVKRQVDERLTLYFDNIREKVAETAGPKKGKGKAAKAKAPTPAPAPAASTGDAAPAEEAKEQLPVPVPDSAGDGSTARGDTAKGKGGAKGGGGKAGVAKKCCEGDKLCAHLSLQDMTALLIKMNVLQPLPAAPLTLPITTASPPPATSLRLAALQGDCDLVGQVRGAAVAGVGGDGGHVEPSYQQLRSFFTERFILPLGSAFVHSQDPAPLRALLLYGPAGSGKSLTARAIAKESGSVFFDLSTRNLEKKLGTKAEIAKLCHLIFAVARECQPAVLYMDEVERVWGTGKGKRGSGEMVRLRQLVQQHLDGLDRSDRILLIGCSRSPHGDRVEAKELLEVFGPPRGEVVLMPMPDVALRRRLWGYFIEQTGLGMAVCEKGGGFDVDELAAVSEGYTAGGIQQAVLSTLPPKRVQALTQLERGLENRDFVAALSQTAYCYRGEYAANVAWLEQVMGVKERRKMREAAEAKEAVVEEDTKPKKK